MVGILHLRLFGILDGNIYSGCLHVFKEIAPHNELLQVFLIFR